MKTKPTAAQQYFNYGKHAARKNIQFVRWQAARREYKLLATTSLKDLIGVKLHVL